MKLANISFLEYYNLKDRDDYNFALKYAEIKERDLLNIGLFTSLSFGFVKDVQTEFNTNGFIPWNEFFQFIHDLTGIHKNKLAIKKLFDLHAFRLYFYKQVEYINELEKNNLGHTSDPDEMAAGIEDFGKYGAFIQFDNLAKGDVLKYDQVRQIEYNVCFTKLLLDAERLEFQERLNKIKSKS
jgi:hypothetical protein